MVRKGPASNSDQINISKNDKTTISEITVFEAHKQHFAPFPLQLWFLNILAGDPLKLSNVYLRPLVTGFIVCLLFVDQRAVLFSFVLFE